MWKSLDSPALVPLVPCLSHENMGDIVPPNKYKSNDHITPTALDERQEQALFFVDSETLSSNQGSLRCLELEQLVAVHL